MSIDTIDEALDFLDNADLEEDYLVPDSWEVDMWMELDTLAEERLSGKTLEEFYRRKMNFRKCGTSWSAARYHLMLNIENGDVSDAERVEYSRKYRQDNKEHLKAYHKAYYEANKEKINAQAREYRKQKKNRRTE